VSTDVDVPVDRSAPVPRRRRGGAWWLVPEVAAVAVLAAVLIYQGATALSPTEVRARVAARAEQLMESLSVSAHHDHGHQVSAESRIVCGIEPIGYEPADAATPEDVRVAYVNFLCASGPPGTTFEQAYKFSGPAVIKLWKPIAVLTVPLNAPYQDGVRQLMPDQYEAQALAGFADPEVPRSVVQRYNGLNSPPPGR
jgi:hypothetical protein